MAENAPAQQSPMPSSEAHDGTAAPDSSSSLPLPPNAKSSDPGLSSAARKRKRPTPNDEGPAQSADFVPFEFGDSPSNPASDCASSSSSALTSSTGAGSIGSKNGVSDDPTNRNQSRTTKFKARKKARRRKKAEDQARANGRADDSGDDGGDSPENQGEALKHGDDSDVDKDALVQRAAADRSGDQQNAEKGKARKDKVGADDMTAKQRKKIRKKEKRRLKKLEAAERAAAFPGGAGGRFDPLPGDQNVSEIGGRARSASISSSSSCHASTDGGSDSEDDSAPTMPGESVAAAAAAPNPDPSPAVVITKPPSPATILAQQKYFQPFVFPDLYHEEDRPMFSHTTPDIRTTTLVSLSSYSVPLQTSLVICNVCTFPGHTSSSCPELTCTHCSAKNSHHSHRCPKKAPGSPSSSSSDRSTFDWRAIKPHRLLTPDSPVTKIRMFCYHCASSGHWGDDCPRLPVPEDPGSFSVEEMKRRGYISEEIVQELEEVSDSDPKHRKFGLGALEGEVPPSWDPFEEFKKTPARPINVAVRNGYGGGSGGGGGGGGGYGSGGRYDGGGGGGRPPRRDGGRDYDRRDGRGRDGGGQSYRPSSYASRDAWNRYQR